LLPLARVHRAHAPGRDRIVTEIQADAAQGLAGPPAIAQQQTGGVEVGRRDLALGLVVVAAMAVGIYLAGSSRGAAPESMAILGEGSALDRDNASLSQAGDANGPNLSTADARLELDGVSVRVVSATRPIRAFDKNRIRFLFTATGEAAGKPLEVEQATVSFTMQMDMGQNRYSLVPAARAGWLQAEFVLPACPSGGRRWHGILAFVVAGRPMTAHFHFDLESQPG
jgi:hypothetical protein